MLVTTILLLAVGALLAALGTAGFALVWQDPASHEDLQYARKTATVGRWLAIPGLCLYAGHYGASGLGLYLIMITVAVTVASLVTKSATRPPATNGAVR